MRGAVRTVVPGFSEGPDNPLSFLTFSGSALQAGSCRIRRFGRRCGLGHGFLRHRAAARKKRLNNTGSTSWPQDGRVNPNVSRYHLIEKAHPRPSKQSRPPTFRASASKTLLPVKLEAYHPFPWASPHHSDTIRSHCELLKAMPFR